MPLSPLYSTTTIIVVPCRCVREEQGTFTLFRVQDALLAMVFTPLQLIIL